MKTTTHTQQGTVLYTGGRGIEFGPVTEHKTIRSLHSMELNERPEFLSSPVCDLRSDR